ncbi:sigma-70 family RNA polymerase sigma factor [Frigoriglobus tundricola]|uniref:ECF RNA polymerase sigma factor SigE n=1 Tax=Frigoriglobus tundricola TaxID=2774151 RepID=A0A6M5YSU3_9BACT|nr:sigma-70 family RNA polymerase sigma factor [Frigoriglobus tundricola]QJW97137.1 hypothetical protein FTUN_4702 [Frigoriglobus tundricola]
MNSAADLTNAIRHLRAPSGGALGDPELLDHYARDHDQAAFAALVWRYGPLVLGVARRQVADRHRAEDVFQATFLALARSATKLGGRAVLANWLYTVALRQARKARAHAARRAALEGAAPPRPRGGADPLAEITGRELLQVIDDELARLPDRLRLPVLLCCVQGLSREEAVRRLGWSEGTLRGRLERGRRKLAARLTARGLAPSAVLLAPLAAVVVPADLLAHATELGAAPWSQSVPPVVAALATAATHRPLLPAVAIAGCLLTAVVVGTFAFGRGQPVEPVALLTSAPLAAAPTKAPPAINDPLPDGATRRFGTARYRHPTTIESLAVSADGKFAVANSGTRINGMIRAYDLATGRIRFAIESEPGALVYGVAVSPDGKTLATKRNHAVYLYDAATGKETGHIEYPGANPSTNTDLIVFAPDGKRVAVTAADGKGLHLIDLTRGEVVRTLPHAHVVFAAAFSPDGKQLVGGGYDSEKGTYFARLWETETGKERHRLPFGNGGIRCVAYSPDGATVAVSGDGRRAPAVKLFDAATGKERLTIPFPDATSVRSLAFGPDGKTLAASGGASTRLFDAATGKEVLKIDRKATGLRFTPDGEALVGAVAGAIYCWDAATGQALTPEGGDSPVAQIEVPADGKRVVTRGQDGDAHVWDARTGAHLRRVDVTWQRGLTLSPDGRYLVWPVGDETVQFKDPDQPNAVHTGSRLRMFDLTTNTFVERFGGFEGGANDLFFTAAGKTLVTVDYRDGAVRFWDVGTGKMERSFRVSERGQYQVWRARLSPDAKVLAVTYQREALGGIFGRHAVKLWDCATGKELHDLPGHWSYVEAVAFSPDGTHLVTGSEPLSAFTQKQLRLPTDQVFVWNVATGKAVAQLPIGATAAAFAPDGKTLAVAVGDGTLQFWDAATWQLRSEFPGPRDRVTALAFGPDGRLYSGALDATVLVWDPKTAKRPPAEPK